MAELCHNCKILEIESVKRPLCKPCYARLHKEGLLYLYPLIRVPVEERLTVRYGPEIIKDFRKIFSRKSNLSKIGAKYGVSRERARQWFVELYDFPFSVMKKNK
jgi:hypothetical protein